MQRVLAKMGYGVKSTSLVGVPVAKDIIHSRCVGVRRE